MTESTITIKNDEEDNDSEAEMASTEAAVIVDSQPINDQVSETSSNQNPAENMDQEQSLLPVSILIPTLEFMADVPADLFPPLLPQNKDKKDLEEAGQDDEYSELYHKLMASTARSAALANRLAEMHRSTNGSFEEEEEEDYEPQTEEDSIVQGATSPDIISDIASEDILEENGSNEMGENEEYYEEYEDEEELEDLGKFNRQPETRSVYIIHGRQKHSTAGRANSA